MFSKIKPIFCVLLLFNRSYTMEMQELDYHNILNFVEIDKQNNQITFKKNSLPLLQELLDSKQESSIFSKENIVGIMLFGAVLANCYFLFQLFDVAKKNSEDINKIQTQTNNLKKESDPLETQVKNLETKTNLIQEALERQNIKNNHKNHKIKKDIQQMKKQIAEIDSVQKFIAEKTNHRLKELTKTFNKLIK